MKTDIRWVIVGVHGLYTGQWFTRKEAIFHHCRDLNKSWEYCKKKGDRTVKATITYKQPKGK
jgi:hypothetical protein